MSILDEVHSLRTEIEKDWAHIDSIESLENFRVKFFGKKGKVQDIIKKISLLSPEERREAGRLINEIKVKFEELVQERKEELLARLGSDTYDLYITPRHLEVGNLHPLSKVVDELLDVVTGLGFEEVGLNDAPDVEWDYYNFECLNIPPYHPSRDMQATFFITDKMLLRTQTSPVQVRTMLQRKPPIRVVHAGRVYRVDAFDATHAPCFYQMEGLYIDRNVSFAELRGTLEVLVREIFGEKAEFRMMPSYFPFTEPSAEGQVRFGEEWLEIFGCGMVHPQVLRNVGLSPEVWSGYAFGLGIERIAMIKYGINDIRLFSDNDIRFLRQL
ncbi:MAG TPA: phenylalanine--tRNA ligase subunit alpha [Candidatus Hydrothermia bacterium]|nr:phenylalanine--tRNA ligase subunit alpha [Candidatus Hydrothermia bacterium]MDD5572352.1 phenylalanine--tRNA ligase subunit alpha [Candidatus Hydrothermia bacterium]HOK23334.1 phenylalanine--tRNA ligase subunit alpha [Candidatus Hydrothermia bacterium]HOL24144.1 phenylalanine--tRNA ligase subunit alpha [Candidatus Hydrothermia bacterium]HOP31967.1 phenylalanine--tRNA ligase subunit alpha [Candidatus Hydrothermia bacterium]